VSDQDIPTRGSRWEPASGGLTTPAGIGLVVSDGTLSDRDGVPNGWTGARPDFRDGDRPGSGGARPDGTAPEGTGPGDTPPDSGGGGTA
jgi:hypothetical protein